MKKKLLIAGLAFVGLVLVAVLGVVLFLDANRFRPQLETAMGNALGRKVSIGNIKTALLSGGIALENLVIADDPAFSSTPFVTAKSVSVGVDLMALVLSRTLHVQSFRLEDPQVALISSQSGQWNFSGLGATSSSPAAPAAAPSAMTVVVQKITIENGRVTLGSSDSAKDKARAYENVNLEVTNLSLISQFPFHLDARAPGGGTMRLDGQAGPFNTADAAETPFQAAVEVADLDVASTGFVDPASGLAGRVTFTGTMASNGQLLTSKGKINATGVRLVPTGTATAVPIEIDYESDYNRKLQSGVVKQGDVHIGKAVARLIGDFNAGGETVALRLKLTGNKMPASDLAATLPAIAVAMPSGASFKQGTLDMNLTINGPMDRLVIAGPINLTNVTLDGFDLAGKLSALPSLGGVSKTGDTVIQTLAVNVRVAPDGIQANGVNVVVPSVGTLTGAGTIAPAGDMNFKMMANTIPFLILGTTANPTFRPDVRGAVAGMLKDPESAKKAAAALGGLFGGRNR